MFKLNRLARTALIALSGMLPPAVHAVGTAAGVDISNTATVSFTDPFGVTLTVNSNASVIKVDEILDVTLTSNDAGNLATTTPASNVALSFTLTNTGNGSETYVLSAVSNLAGDAFDPSNVRIYLDANGDNILDTATDTLLVPGSNDPVLAADASLRVFVVSDIPSGLANGNTALVRLLAESATARATPAADAPGTAFAGQGTGGSDAVVGSSQADASAQIGYVISLVSASLVKTSTVLDPFGGSNAIPGATITYTLSLSVVGSGDLNNATITDAIPANTTYVPESMTLDSAALTDAADSDRGVFASNAITVTLADPLTAPATHTVTFKVTINN